MVASKRISTNYLKKNNMATIPSPLEMLKAGVHFGHQTFKRHPKMKPYIFTKRNGVSIIDLEQTKTCLETALEFASQITANGGVILFLGTKKQAREAIKKAALASESPYITTRWIGGTFTNYENISKLFARLKELERGFESGEWKKYTKKEQVTLSKEMEKLQSFVGGIKDMNKLPKAVFVVDIKKEQTAVAEANKRGIPVIAMVDTNVNPEMVQYAIPANDDAVKSIDMIATLLAETITEAKKTKTS